MVHAALLLLMLEAVFHGPRFRISLKRSTQNLTTIPQAAGRFGHLLLDGAGSREQTGPVQDQMSVGWFARARGPGRECQTRAEMGRNR